MVPTAKSTQTIPKPLISLGLDANPAYTRCFYKGASRGNFYTVGEKRGEHSDPAVFFGAANSASATLELFRILESPPSFSILENSQNLPAGEISHLLSRT